MIRRSPLPKRTMPIAKKRAVARTWRCQFCLSRNVGRRCLSCKIGKGTKRTSLKARCDALARKLCRLLAGGLCARCGGPGSDWSHRLPRRHHAVRWDVVGNSDYLCRKDHRYFTDNPFAFAAWLASRGVDLDALATRALAPWDKDYSAVLADLTAQLAAAEREAA